MLNLKRRRAIFDKNDQFGTWQFLKIVGGFWRFFTNCGKPPRSDGRRSRRRRGILVGKASVNEVNILKNKVLAFVFILGDGFVVIFDMHYSFQRKHFWLLVVPLNIGMRNAECGIKETIPKSEFRIPNSKGGRGLLLHKPLLFLC